MAFGFGFAYRNVARKFGSIIAPPIVLGMLLTVDTTITDVDSSDALTMHLPISNPSGIVVDWGDGTITVATHTHLYAVGGVKNISITGMINTWNAASSYGTDSLKILSVSNIGELVVYNTSQFRACANLTELNLTKPVIPQTSNLSNWASHNPVLTRLDFSQWDFELVENASSIARTCILLTEISFRGANFVNLKNFSLSFAGNTRVIKYDFIGCRFPELTAMIWAFSGGSDVEEFLHDNIGGMPKVTSLRGIFNYMNSVLALDLSFIGYASLCTNYSSVIAFMGDAGLNITGCDTLDFTSTTNLTNFANNTRLSIAQYAMLLARLRATIVATGVSFHGGFSQYVLGSQADTDRQWLIDNRAMIITDGGGIAVFDSLWDTSNTTGTNSDSFTVVLPITVLVASGLTIDWGDGTVNSLRTHTYAVGGVKNITIVGTITGWAFNGDETTDKDKLIAVNSIGDFVVDAEGAFSVARNLTILNIDRPIIGSSFRSFIRATHALTTFDTTNLDTASTDKLITFAFRSGITSLVSPNLIGSTTTSIVSIFGSMVNVVDVDISDSAYTNVADARFAFQSMLKAKTLLLGNSTWTSLRFANQMFRNLFDVEALDMTPFANSPMEEMQSMLANIAGGVAGIITNVDKMNFSNAIALDLFLEGSKLDTPQYDLLLSKLRADVVPNGLNFHGGSSQYTIGSQADTDRQWLITNKAMIITDGGGI